MDTPPERRGAMVCFIWVRVVAPNNSSPNRVALFLKPPINFSHGDGIRINHISETQAPKVSGFGNVNPLDSVHLSLLLIRPPEKIHIDPVQIFRHRDREEVALHDISWDTRGNRLDQGRSASDVETS